MSGIKVLIAAPLRQDLKIFREHERSLDELIIPDGVTVDRYYVVNDCPEVIPEIHGEFEICNTGDLYTKTGDTHLWTRENLYKMHLLRNMTVRRAKGYDYWFSVDTDLVLQPQTLQVLLDADKDIVSELFWTRGWCNAWMYDQSQGMDLTWKTPGLYQVGMTGACTLVKAKVFEAGVDYTPIPCINKCLWGEDRHFSIRAACHGFEMWADSHCPPDHLYTDTEYQEYMQRRQRHA